MADTRGTRERDTLSLWKGTEARLELYLRSFRALGAEDREDVLSRTLSAFLASGPVAADADAVRAWLYRVARNAALDATRARKREAARRADGRDSETLVAELPSPHPGPEGLALRGAERDFVRRHLASLPDRDRELLHLAFAEDMPYARIAEILALPLGTVKWRIAVLKRALERRYRREFE